MKSGIFTFLTMILISSFTYAQTFVKQDAVGSNDGSSWANAYTDLQSALDNTNATNIWVAAGTYSPGAASPDPTARFAIGHGVSLYGGFEGTENMLEQRNITANKTILSGDHNGDDIDNDFTSNRSDNSLHVIYIDSLISSTVIIDGFTIQGGNTESTSTQPPYFYQGGGIFSLSKMEVYNCDFNNNFGRSGGSIYIEGEDANGTVIKNCTFLRNSANSQSAGILINLISGAVIEGCTFGDNETNRGALYVLRCPDAIVRDCDFLNNSNPTGFGGGMYNWSSPNLQLLNSNFVGNTASSSGALYVDGRELSIKNMHIEGCTFDGNSAANTGGAVYFSRSIYTVENCTFKNNQATWGGGTANYTEGEGDYSNCVFQSNISFNGGGATTMGFQSKMTYTDCEFLENNGGWGAGMFSQNDFTSAVINNCVFNENQAPGGQGGGFYGIGGGLWEFNDCEFQSNLSETGAAISVIEDSLDVAQLDLNNIEFIFNVAELQGGGISNSNVDITVTNCLFNTNRAEVDDANEGGLGGAISNNASTSTFSDTVVSAAANIMIVNSTFASNIGEFSAGLVQWEEDETAEATITLQNCILANLGLNYAIEQGTPSVVSIGGNLSTDNTLNDYLIATNDLTETDPEFKDEGTFDFHLAATSPCIDKGIAAGAPTLDLDGNPRENEVDMGAYEFQTIINVPQLIVDASALNIQPNPASQFTTIELNNEWRGDLMLELYNALGQQVMVKNLKKDNEGLKEELSLVNVQSGIYQVVIHNQEQAVTKMLIKH